MTRTLDNGEVTPTDVQTEVSFDEQVDACIYLSLWSAVCQSQGDTEQAFLAHALAGEPKA